MIGNDFRELGQATTHAFVASGGQEFSGKIGVSG
jgi:hypothetical protein